MRVRTIAMAVILFITAAFLVTALVAQEPPAKKTVTLKSGTQVLVQEILEYVADLTGYEVISSPGIGKRSVEITSDMEATADMLESLLKINRVTLILQEKEGKKYYEAVADVELPRLRYGTGKFYQEGAELPKENVIVTVPLTVKFIDPRQVETMLNMRLIDKQGIGVAICVPKTTVVLIHDFAPRVAHYIELIKEMDKPAPSEVKVIQLKHAAPEDIVKSLRSGTGEPKEMPECFPDATNSRVVLVGEPSALDKYAKVVEALDCEATEEAFQFVTYRLKSATAKDISAVLNSLLSESEKERGFVAVPENASNCVVVRADKVTQGRLQTVIEALDSTPK